MYRLKLSSERVKRELDRLPHEVYARIETAIVGLAKNPRPKGTAKLVGSPVGDYRLRVGGHRIIYDVYDAPKEVVILKVSKRSDAYR